MDGGQACCDDNEAIQLERMMLTSSHAFEASIVWTFVHLEV